LLVKDPRTVAHMFDAVAHRYDLLNQVLSLGIDGTWRRALARALEGIEGPLLDVCTGTGDVALAVCRHRREMHCLGVDFAPRMIRRGRAKVAAAGFAGRIGFCVGDAMSLALRSSSVGAVTIAFGIRNVKDPNVALDEMHRVLRPGGRVAVLEFSLPSSALVRAVYLLYFRRVLPRVGALLSGARDAYRYLPASVAVFPEGDGFRRLMVQAGFTDVGSRTLSAGIATLYTGAKPEGR
jgi:demethylmenaquinone methyltransferase/2-methoxy-6-polyprenyl-1,4-benzoquinol methylase